MEYNVTQCNAIQREFCCELGSHGFPFLIRSRFARVFEQTPRRRRPVSFDEELRSEVIRVASEVRELIKIGRLPPPVADRRCVHCTCCRPNIGQCSSPKSTV